MKRAVAAPGHGKDMVYCLNARNKKYLEKMFMIATLLGNEVTLGEDKIIPYSVQ